MSIDLKDGRKIDIVDDRDIGKDVAKEAAALPKMSKEQIRAAGVRRMRELMKVERLRGNPKDFVLAVKNTQILDFERAIMVKASLPEKIDHGNHVWNPDRDGRLRPLRVVEDLGDNLKVTNETAEFLIPRSEAYPTGLPIAPTLIHKSRLRFLVGEKVGGIFWNARINQRTTQ